MRRFHLRFIIGLAAIGWGYAAVAQMPAPVPSAAPVPEQMPFNIPIGPSIDLAQAKELAAAAEAEAAARQPVFQKFMRRLGYEKRDG